MIPHRYLIAALIVPLAACQTTPPHNEALKEAREAYATATLQPHAEQAASNELLKARQALDRAERAWAERGDEGEVRHLAYLAYRRAQAAHLVADRSQQEALLQTAGLERERIRASASQRDALLAQQRADQAGNRADELARALEQMQAQRTERGLVVTVRDVLFETDRAQLPPGALRTADLLADVLKQHPRHRIRIEGFADSQGSEAHNLRLSTRRALAFRDALVQRGVSADRIDTQGLGEAFPVASNRTAEGRQQNRRIEVLFSDESGQLKPRS